MKDIDKMVTNELFEKSGNFLLKYMEDEEFSSQDRVEIAKFIMDLTMKGAMK